MAESVSRDTLGAAVQAAEAFIEALKRLPYSLRKVQTSAVHPSKRPMIYFYFNSSGELLKIGSTIRGTTRIKEQVNEIACALAEHTGINANLACKSCGHDAGKNPNWSAAVEQAKAALHVSILSEREVRLFHMNIRVLEGFLLWAHNPPLNAMKEEYDRLIPKS